MADLFDMPISLGTIHNRLMAAAKPSTQINVSQDLSPIQVGLHDEIFQGNQPLLTGVDATSTYCYIRVEAEHRDAVTWGVHLLAAKAQGLNPSYTIADAATGLRAGHRPPSITSRVMATCSAFSTRARRWPIFLGVWPKGLTTHRQRLEQHMMQPRLKGRGNSLSSKLAKARKAETLALSLAKHIKTLAAP